MGESFLGLPNRFKVIDNLLESTYNPNHVLSAYQGYKLSTDYLKRTGGEDYKMEGPLYTESMVPNRDVYYGNYGTLTGSDIGAYDRKYRYVYAMYYYGDYFSGNATTASRLQNKINLSITGAVTGTTSFDGSGNVEVNVSTNHTHDGKYLPLTGGSMTGNIKLDGYGIGLTDKSGRQLLASDSASTLYVGQGPYVKNTGSLSLYSSHYLNLYTKQDEIRLNIESSTHAPSTPYISIGADKDGAYIKYSKNASRLYLGSNVMTYNGYTVYHSGNLKLTDYAPSSHTHDGVYLPLSGGTMKGNIRFPSSNYGIIDIYGGRMLGYDTNNGYYSVVVGGTMKDDSGVYGNVALYTRKHPVAIKAYDSYEVLRLNSAGKSNVVFSLDDSGSELASEYYEGSTMHRNSLRIPLKKQDELTYNGYTVYHSGNLKLTDYSPSSHTHDYIPNSDKYQPNAVTHSDYNNSQGRMATLKFISHWNGAYNSSGSSNLAYCNKGAFGTIVTKSSSDYLSITGGTMIGGLTLNLGSTLKTYKIVPPMDQACVHISRTGNENLANESTSNFLDAAIDDIASDRIVPSSIFAGINSSNGSSGIITIGIDKSATVSYKGLRVKYVTQNSKVKIGSTTVGGAYDVTDDYAPVYCKSTSNPSDIRLKENIHDIDMKQSVRILSKLTPVSYNFKDSVDNETNRGIIAQQLKEIMLDEGCKGQIYSDSNEGTMMVNYTELIPDIINVLKYLLYKVDKEHCFDDISKSLMFNEAYYREHAEEIAKK